MFKPVRLALAVCLLVSSQAFAATFIVPDDRELVGKARGIIVGTVVDKVSERGSEGDIETIYSVRIERALKGGFERDSIVKVTSPGGQVEKRFTLVPGSAHFDKDDRVLLFLSMHKGNWTPTDWTLGKFKFVTSTGGQSLLLRDEEDIVGFDKEMRTHVEQIRREKEFLAFVEETVRGRKAEADYFVPPGETVSLPKSEKNRFDVTANAFTPDSYSLKFGAEPGRWADVLGQFSAPIRMSATVATPFFKNVNQDASGLGDGGVAMITSSLNAWNNDCGSIVNAPYAGENTALKDPDDAVNAVIWNDPGAHIAGTFTGSGVVATAFLGGEDRHTFAGLTNGWISIFECDVVVQNAVTGAEAFTGEAMTHEMGHCMGLRHSNQNGNNGSCSGSDECTSTSIMNSSVSGAFNFTLQTWDQTAIRALYPGNCVSAPAAPTNVTIFSVAATSVSLSWSASDGATSYKVYRRTGPGAYSFLANVPVGTSHVDTTAVSGTAYQYVVHAVNGGGESGDSNSDFAAAIAFTDTMASGLAVKVLHFNELRTAVNALRTLAGLSTFNFTAPAPAAGVSVRKAHVDDLRTALNQARTALGASTITFGETLVAGTTKAKPSHMTELRNGVF